MVKAVIYARCANKSKGDISTEFQIKACRNYAQENGILISGTYTDIGSSGMNSNRSKFQQLINDSSTQEWDIVLVYKFDRFSRNRYDLLFYKDQLSNYGVKLVSVCDNAPDGTIFDIIADVIKEGISC